jgi:hypothetical protein
MLPALLLPHTCAAASPSYDTMGCHRAGSGVRLGVYLGDMGLKTIAMSNLPAMTALALLELQASLFRVRHGSTARATRGARTDHRTRCTPSVGARRGICGNSRNMLRSGKAPRASHASAAPNRELF